MKSEKKHILFITPSLASTGSEVLLFHFINFLADRYTISVICFNRGNLISSLNKSVEVHSLSLGDPTSVYGKILKRVKIHITLPFLLNRYKKYLWYINTITLPIPLKYAVDNGIDFFLHVHELKHMYNLLSKSQLNFALNKPARLIANSAITKQHLMQAGSSRSIDVLTPFIDVDLINSLKKNIPDSPVFTWVMAGSIDKNKNPILFIDIAREARNKKLPYVFVWLYHSIGEQEVFSEITALQQKEDLHVKFFQTKDYKEYIGKFSSSNGFLLTSTYESFSMVTLEALTLGMPMVLNDCGGIDEFLNEDVASVIPKGSLPEVYLEQMDLELKRSETTRSEKNKIAKTFNKTRILDNWEQLLIQSGKK